MILNLPFLYTVSMRRGSQRKPRDYLVRGYTSVDIAEVASSELTEVIRMNRTVYPVYGQRPGIEVTRSFLEWHDSLVLPVEQKMQPVTPREFEGDLSEVSLVEVKDERGRLRRPYSTLWFHFPTPRCRFADESGFDPRQYPTQFELVLKMEGEAHPIVRSDFAAREEEAQIRLRKFVVIVDGVINVAVREPVWRQGRTRVESGVTSYCMRSDPYRAYRLDRAPAQLNGPEAGSDRTTVLRPDLLRRDDVLELTLCALDLWPKWGPRVLSAGGEFAGPIGLCAIVNAIAGSSTPPNPQQCIAVLETYRKARTALAAQQRQRFWDNGYSVPDVAGAIATRWRREREEYLALHDESQLSAEDIDALEGLV